MAKTKVHGEYLDPSVISGQTQVTAVGADSVLIFDATDNALKKALLSDVIETVGSTPSFTSATISGDLTVDTTTFKVDSSNNRVGIGTTSPTSVLHVAADSAIITLKDTNGSGNAATPYVLFEDSGGTDLGYVGFGSGGNSTMFVTNYADADLEFLTNSSTRMTIDNSGNVGIGTTSPSANLHIQGTNSDVGVYTTKTGAGTARFAYDSIGPYILDEDSNPFRIYTGGSERIRILSGGNVGIGTTTPQSLLQVAQPNGTMSHFGGIAVTNTHFSGISLGYTEAGNANYRKAAIVQEQIGDGAARGHMHLLVDTANDGNSAVLADAKLSIHGTSGNVGIGDSNPQHPLKVHLTNGEIAMFGSNGMNSPGQYAGIGLGQVLANNTTYQKVSLVTEGRNSGSYVQDFHILVDTAADSGSAVLADKKFTIDGSSGAVVMPSQPVAVYTHSANSEVGAYAYQWASTGANTITMRPQQTVVNRGSMYNTSNGRWTAPVTGIYRYAIHGNLYTTGIASNAYFTLRILKNGSTHVLYHYEDNSVNSAGGWHYKNYAGIVELDASDFIEMQLITNNLTDASRQNFGWDTSSYTHYEFHLLY